MLVFIPIIFAQERETFDLTTFTTLPGWQKELTDNSVNYTMIENDNWCQIGIYKSTGSKGSIEQDFESEWKELILAHYNPVESSPENEVLEEDGWKIKSGGARFNFKGSNALVMLITIGGYNRCVSIVATTNSQDYMKDIETLTASIELKKPESISPPLIKDQNNTSIIGIWRRGTGSSNYSGRWSSSGYQYTFNSNGTYNYIVKTYVEDDKETLLTRESGNYLVRENDLTLDPKINVIEAWSKSNGGDNYKHLITSQNMPIEKITYQFVLHYFPELKETGLVLLYGNETARDGKYNGSDSFPKGWRFSQAGPDYKPIKLPVK